MAARISPSTASACSITTASVLVIEGVGFPLSREAPQPERVAQPPPAHKGSLPLSPVRAAAKLLEQGTDVEPGYIHLPQLASREACGYGAGYVGGLAMAVMRRPAWLFDARAKADGAAARAARLNVWTVGEGSP